MIVVALMAGAALAELGYRVAVADYRFDVLAVLARLAELVAVVALVLVLVG